MSEKVVATVNGKEYDLIKVGFDQAKQVARIVKWLGKWASGMASSIVTTDGTVDLGSGIGFITGLAEAVEAEALVELFALVIGCTDKVAKDHFDIMVLVDATELLLDKQESYRKVIERFFSDKS